MDYRERMLTQQPTQVATCSMCQASWQRPVGMLEARCPRCANRQGSGGLLDASEQLAASVTAYRIAIERATHALRHRNSAEALEILLKVEAPGRSIGNGPQGHPPPRAPDKPKAQTAPPVVAASGGRASPERAPSEDPIDLVRALALGTYRLPAKRAARARKSGTS